MLSLLQEQGSRPPDYLLMKSSHVGANARIIRAKFSSLALGKRVAERIGKASCLQKGRSAMRPRLAYRANADLTTIPAQEAVK